MTHRKPDPHSASPTPDNGGRFATDDGLVEKLVKIADSGPEIPADGPARVKAAIRPEWQRQVAANQRRRRMTWSIGLAAAASLIAVVAVSLRSGPDPLAARVHVATVARVTGIVTVVGPDGSASMLDENHLGAAIEAGSVLRTDTATRASLILTKGQILRIDHSTALTLTSAATMTLEQGAIYADSGSEGQDGLAIHTDLGTATDIGTQFEVRTDESGLVIRVREGTVRLDRDDAESLVVPPGFQAGVSPDGQVETKVIKTSGPTWDWPQEIAPTFDLEGQSVMAFLDWVSRETGLWIRFDDPATEVFAIQTLLHGTTSGLSPLGAPEVVLASCGLAPRFEKDSLYVEHLVPR